MGRVARRGNKVAEVHCPHQNFKDIHKGVFCLREIDISKKYCTLCIYLGEQRVLDNTIKGSNMTQDYRHDIQKEIQSLILNYPNHVIRSTTDWNVITVGRLQIENLDWKWQPEWSKQLNVYMEFDPYDWMSASPINPYRGNFVVTKYGLSCREKPLTLASYKPLYGFEAKPDEMARIMGQEMVRMQKEGAKKCENGIEIVPESPLFDTVNRLANKSRNTFRTLLGQKAQDLEVKHVSYDSEKVWDAGVRVTPEIVAILRTLSDQITK